ncbi:MAG: pyridoxal phosphate-dependent aminotransferase [Bacteroidetes bacterium]|nr:MAG: pyridoxal phosphate-dependent aminotransferase [Bacteroidota bacterium]
MQQVQAPIIPIVGQWVRDHPGTISLGQGVVYYGPPPQVQQCMARFGQQPEHHLYQAVQGIAPLRECIAQKLQQDNGIFKHREQRIFVTAGGNMAFANAIFAIADPGDEVILLTPYYFNHEMAIRMASCQPVLVPTDEQYQLQIDRIEAAITPKTRAVVTISPNNPTGAVYPEQDLRAVNEVCKQRGIYHICDEAYEYFTYEGVPHFAAGSIAGSHEHTISLFSLSKSFGFAGWRIGYMLMPAHLFEAVRKIQDTQLICPPVVSQHAAIAAMKVGRSYCRAHLQQITHNRQLFQQGLQQLSSRIHLPKAEGAFYFFLRLPVEKNAMEVVEQLIKAHGVAAIPGTAFGADEGCYLRVAYGALQREGAQEGIRRLVEGIKAILQ